MPKRMQRVSKTQPHDYASRLKVGQTFNSYAELCKHLNEPASYHTDEKARQLEIWSHYFTFAIQNNQFVITDVFDTSPDAVQYLTLKQNTVAQLVALCIEHILAQQNQNRISVTMQQLLRMIGMVSTRYKQIPLAQIQSELPIEDITALEVEQCYTLIDTKLSRVLKDALERLSKRHLVYYNIGYVGIKLDTDGKTIIERKHFTADDDIAKSLDISHMALQNLGYYDMTDVALHKAFKKFFQERNKLAKKYFGYDIVYMEYNIYSNPDTIRSVLEIDNRKMVQVMEQINKLVTEKVQPQVIQQVVNTCLRAKEKAQKYNDTQRQQLAIGTYQDKTLNELVNECVVFTYKSCMEPLIKYIFEHGVQI